MQPEAARDGQVRLWLSYSYLDKIEIHRIMPEPVKVETGRDGLTYVFAVTDPGQPTKVTFHFEAEQMGSTLCQAGVAGEPPATFRQITYP